MKCYPEMCSVPQKSWCVFCNIVNKLEPATILYEDDEIMCFLDIYPASRFHMQTIPKIHIDNAKCLNYDDITLGK